MNRVLSIHLIRCMILILLATAAATAAEPTEFMVRIRQPGSEKKIEDFREYPYLRTLWQMPAVMSLRPNGPQLTEQFLLIEVPASQNTAWVRAGYHPIRKLSITITVEREGYCFGSPSGLMKRSGSSETDPATALWMVKRFFQNPFGALKDWNHLPGMVGVSDALVQAPRQDNGWRFRFTCSLGVQIPALEDYLSAEIGRVNGQLNYRVGFREKGLPLPIFEMNVQSAWVENRQQGPAQFESPINMGDLNEKGATVTAGRGFDVWARDFRWNMGKVKPYYGVFETLRDGSVQSTTSYTREDFANMARQHLVLVDRPPRR